MQMEQVTEPAGAVASDALSLGVYSRIVIVQPLSEALNGLHDTIPDRLFAELKSTYDGMRDAILLETSPGHFAQIADEFISLSDRAATKFGDLKPFYDLGVMLGEIGVEVAKIGSCDQAVMRLLQAIPKWAEPKTLPVHLRKFSPLVKRLSGFLEGDSRFKKLWDRTRPDLKSHSPHTFIQTIIDNLVLQVPRVLIKKVRPRSEDERQNEWIYNNYKRPEITMEKLIEMLDEECNKPEHMDWTSLGDGGIRSRLNRLYADGWPRIEKKRGRPKMSVK